MNNNPFQYSRVDAELLHACYFKLHDQLRTAGDTIAQGLMLLHKLEVRAHGNDRTAFKAMIVDLDGYRDRVAAILSDAGTTRTQLIQKTGCDRKCQTPEYQPDAAQ